MSQSIILKNTLVKLMIGSSRSRAVNAGSWKKLSSAHAKRGNKAFGPCGLEINTQVAAFECTSDQ